MYAFAISAVGAVIIGAVLEFFIVDGEIKKYTTAGVSLIIIVIILTPVVGLVGGGFDWDKLFSNADSDVILDEDFLSKTQTARANQLCDLINDTFIKLDYRAKIVSFEIGADVLIKKINISTLDTVIMGKEMNIVDTEDIVAVVKSVAKSNVKDVIIDGKYVG